MVDQGATPRRSGVRNQPERVSAFDRNGCPDCSGFSVRFRPDYTDRLVSDPARAWFVYGGIGRRGARRPYLDGRQGLGAAGKLEPYRVLSDVATSGFVRRGVAAR